MSSAPMRATAGLTPFNAAGWYQEHEQLSYAFVVAIAKASIDSSRAARIAAEHAHDALLQHAQLILGSAAPVVLTRDGKHTIPYKEVADLRARVRVLSAELAALRAQTEPRSTLPNPKVQP